MQNKEEVNGVSEHLTAARIGLSNKVKANNSTQKIQNNQDEDKPKAETKLREFKFRKNHELLNHKEKEIIQDFIVKSPEKIHPGQLCPEVKLETLNLELQLMVEKSCKFTDTASQPTEKLTTSRTKLDDDFSATCSLKRKEMSTKSKLSLKRRKYEEQESVRKVSEVNDNENPLSEVDTTEVRHAYFEFACVYSESKVTDVRKWTFNFCFIWYYHFVIHL